MAQSFQYFLFFMKFFWVGEMCFAIRLVMKLTKDVDLVRQFTRHTKRNTTPIGAVSSLVLQVHDLEGLLDAHALADAQVLGPAGRFPDLGLLEVLKAFDP